MEKFIGHFIVACLLFLAGYALLYGWNWLSDNITPKWMKTFMVFDRAKEFFVFEATRRFNIIGIIIVLVTRWVFYFLLTFIPMNYLMDKLYKPEMYAPNNARATTVALMGVMIFVPSIMGYPDAGICYVVVYVAIMIMNLFFINSEYTKYYE